MTTAPLPAREHQATVLIPFSHAANADGGAVATKIYGPSKPFVVDAVKYINVTGLAEHASNYGIVAIQKPQVIADDVVNTVDTANDELEFDTPHAYETGDGPLRLTTTGGAPAGLATGVDYFAIRSGTNAVKFATTLDNALRGTAINITDAGTGVHTVIDQATTRRVLAYTCSDSDLPGANGITANTQLSLANNSQNARTCDADDVLEVLASEFGTTTIPAGTGMIEARLTK